MLAEGLTTKYLGLPTYIGKARKRTFEYIKEKVWKRIQGWKEKMLSKVGKEILIKAVAQAIPVYTMACFDITKALCEELSSMIGRYWWSQMDKQNKIHWVSWEKMSKPKKDGGLGFRDLYPFDLAMLARQAWRILQNPSSLCARVLSARYYPGKSLLEATPNSGISYAWRSILKGIQLLKRGIIWRLGNGENTEIWKDPWIPRGVTRRVLTQKGRNLITRVAELIDPNTNTWDTQLVQQTFLPEDVSLILQIPIHEHSDDFLAWHFDKKVDERSDFKWRNLWTLPLPNKVIHFLWRVTNYSLPLRTKLHHRAKQRCQEGYHAEMDITSCGHIEDQHGWCFPSGDSLWRLGLHH